MPSASKRQSFYPYCSSICGRGGTLLEGRGPPGEKGGGKTRPGDAFQAQKLLYVSFTASFTFLLYRKMQELHYRRIEELTVDPGGQDQG